MQTVIREPDLAGSSILVVDDNPNNLQVIGNALKGYGFRLHFVLHGAQVEAAVAANNPDLILLDVRMPDVDGFDVCRQLQADPRTARIPVIFVTAAYKDSESIVRGFEVGGVDYITKPFFAPELIARVRTHLQLKKYKDHLERLSSTDTLTGLLNRRGMSERLAAEESRVRRSEGGFAVCIADVDHFKAINDTHGHQLGDDVLESIAATMRSAVREHDVVARWGGEEFLLLLPDTGVDGAHVLAEKLRCAVQAQSFTSDVGSFEVTMTFGVALWSTGSSIAGCIREADDALYEGKRQGRNRVVVADADPAGRAELAARAGAVSGGDTSATQGEPS